MSLLPYSDAINAPDLQVWDNAAFDNEESEDSAAIKSSWLNTQHLYVNVSSNSLQSDCSKENMSPVFEKCPVTIKPSRSINSDAKPLDLSSQTGISKPLSVISANNFTAEQEVDEERKIDSEIQEIEKEISRLSTRLQALRLEKEEKNAKTTEKRRTILSSKFMEPKLCSKTSEGSKKIEVPNINSSAKSKLTSRGVSLGPLEIFAGIGACRTRISLGPSEIAGVGSRRPGKLEVTPVQPIQSRRKSCFWKLQDIEEVKVPKGRRNSSSVSPKSRRTTMCMSKQATKQAATTVGSKRPAKKDDIVLGSIQPKKLFFKDGEKSVPNSTKKPLKSGRVVPSRYNQGNGNSVAANKELKRSLPENDKDDVKRLDKKRASSVGKSRGKGMENRVKKRWEIPSEVVVYQGVKDDDKCKMEGGEMSRVLPKIRMVRYGGESPRDSGPAKRVSELMGLRPYFRDDEVQTSICQALSFTEEDDEEE